MNIEANIQRAKQQLQECDAIFITAGAGMGVDMVQISLEKVDTNKSPYTRVF